jgi:serralysin
MPDAQTDVIRHRHKPHNGGHGITPHFKAGLIEPPQNAAGLPAAQAEPDTGHDSFPTLAATHWAETQTAVQSGTSSDANPVSPSQASEISFISGVNADGTVAAKSFKTWTGTTPAVYRSTYSFASKWGGATPTTGSLAGSSGGTVYYYFDPAANWTAGEQASFTACFALWSAVANITFVQTTDTALENIELKRGTDGGAAESETSQYVSAPGSTVLYNQGSGTPNADGASSGVVISIDTSVYGWSNLASITDAGGYDIETILHEEGHALGLGHGGAYNGSVNAATQQYSAYDTRLWTLMSYIEPATTTAKYYASYSVTGTSWQGHDPTTWMPLDILAAQELYGAATSTPLSGGQVFGFNCNVDASIREFFDFTVNVNPVCTLYDTGTNNTLDLSGYSAAATVDLRAGDYSSFDGMVNNMAIAFGTKIDNFAGGAGTNAIYTNADADHIAGGAGHDTVYFYSNLSAYVLSRLGSTVLVTNSGTGITDTLVNVETLSFADQLVQSAAIPCFLAGTAIATAGGPRTVESLAPGDLVLTADGAIVPVRWVGRRAVAAAFAARQRYFPIRIQAGALGEGLPARDLLVSPDHAMFLDGVLAQAGALVNGGTITQEQAMPECFTYYHVEVADHALILAEGAATESFIDNVGRMNFDNWAEYEALQDGTPAPAELPYPRAKSARQLPAALRRRLAPVPPAQRRAG